MRYSLQEVHRRSVLLSLLHLTTPTDGFPWDDVRKILHGAQTMAKVQKWQQNIPESFNPSRVHEQYRRQDRFAMAKT